MSATISPAKALEEERWQKETAIAIAHRNSPGCYRRDRDIHNFGHTPHCKQLAAEIRKALMQAFDRGWEHGWEPKR